jgi:hypothetical protein
VRQVPAYPPDCRLRAAVRLPLVRARLRGRIHRLVHVSPIRGAPANHAGGPRGSEGSEAHQDRIASLTEGRAHAAFVARTSTGRRVVHHAQNWTCRAERRALSQATTLSGLRGQRRREEQHEGLRSRRHRRSRQKALPQQLARGHDVVGTTRSASKEHLLRSLGARPAAAAEKPRRHGRCLGTRFRGPTRGPNVDWTTGSTMRSGVELGRESPCK